MRIDLILLLASSAHLTGNNCLAVAAGSEHPTTQNKATIESVDENRVTTSERSLRVRATRDEEDEERVSGASVEKMSSKVMQFVMKSLSSKEDKALKTIDRLFPEPSGGNLETNYAALKEGLENTEMVNKLVKSHPDLLFETLTTRFKDLYLPRALVEMASKKGAAESVKTLRDKQMDRLVEKGMTPDLFVDTLGFTSNGKMGPYGFESLDEFLKAYKRVKPKAPPVNIGEVLVSKPSLARERQFLLSLAYHATENKNHVALEALDKILPSFKNLKKLLAVLKEEKDELLGTEQLSLLNRFVDLHEGKNPNAMLGLLLHDWETKNFFPVKPRRKRTRAAESGAVRQEVPEIAARPEHGGTDLIR